MVAVALKAARGRVARRHSCRSPSSSSAVLLLVAWGLYVRRSARRRRRCLPADLGHRSAARLGLLAASSPSASIRAPRNSASGKSPARARSAACSAGCSPSAWAPSSAWRRCFRSSPCMNLAVRVADPAAWPRALPSHARSHRPPARSISKRRRLGRACACFARRLTCGASPRSSLLGTIGAALVDYVFKVAGGGHVWARRRRCSAFSPCITPRSA